MRVIEQAWEIETTEPHGTLCHQPCSLCSFIYEQTSWRHHQVIIWEHPSCRDHPGCNPLLLDNLKILWWKTTPWSTTNRNLHRECNRVFCISLKEISLPAYFSHAYLRSYLVFKAVVLRSLLKMDERPKQSRIWLFPPLCNDLRLVHSLTFKETHFCVPVQRGI